MKTNLPGIVSAVLSGIFFLGTWLVNSGGKSQHNLDVQADQERRLELLEKDTATRREVDAVKQTVDRIENKLDAYREEELKYHHRP
jgi:hypothetical protein